MMDQDCKQSLVERELRFIVGRERELDSFEKMLRTMQQDSTLRLLHLYGTGGVGKSTFLRLCRQKAQQSGARYFQLDSRDFNHSERGFGMALLPQLGVNPQPVCDPIRLSVDQLARHADNNECPIVLAIDTFEEMQDMENWLRDRFIPMLPPRMLILTAGRHPLRGGWLLSPVWRERTQQLPLTELHHEACTEYLTMCGITDELLKEKIWRRTNGHPLAMSLAAASYAQMPHANALDASDWFDQLASLWLQEVRDRELIRFIEAASVMRVFDQEKLSSIMKEELSPDLFDRLVALSFVRRTERGWQMHDQMRESMLVRLKARMPKRYRDLMTSCALYYAKAILESADRSTMDWEVGELFRYADVDVLRALTSDDDRRYYWEAVTETTLRDATAYAQWRESNTDPVSGIHVDPITGKSFRIEYTAEQVRFNAAPLDLEVLYKLEPMSLRLLRDEEDKACALAICIPIHAGTMTWLQTDPLFTPYLHTLTETERCLLAAPSERPAGWFLRSIDFADILNPMIRTAGIRLIYSYLCRGGILVTTPYDSEIGRQSYTAFGFSPVEGATHCHHDGRTPSPTYVLDTRGDKLPEFINRLFQRTGMELKLEGYSNSLPHSGEPLSLTLLSNREREVALEAAAGYSNVEISERLYISESTVKKHLKSIYIKLEIRNRSQLTAKLMSKRGIVPERIPSVWNEYPKGP
ncbi:LuxR C-terminal-related transcriptional regulator [Paenibacillus chartarius]|uniref:LuxR C-terminal-related transcriptional regulator n=1 Tax=Paenibacillus chartarius TaxID=747481 RepID=A0ABV6DJV7_9BACL